MTEEAKRVVPKELIDSLLAGYKKPEDLIGENGLLKQLINIRIKSVYSTSSDSLVKNGICQSGTGKEH